MNYVKEKGKKHPTENRKLKKLDRLQAANKTKQPIWENQRTDGAMKQAVHKTEQTGTDGGNVLERSRRPASVWSYSKWMGFSKLSFQIVNKSYLWIRRKISHMQALKMHL